MLPHAVAAGSMQRLAALHPSLIKHCSSLHHIKVVAMSWTALNQQLRQLLPRFRLPADNPAALELSQQLVDLGGEGGVLPMLQASRLAPSQADKQALRQ